MTAMLPERRVRALDLLLLTTVLVTTWHKIHWSAGGADVSLEDALALGFLLVFAIDRLERADWRLPPGAAALLLPLIGLEAVYLLGFFNLESSQALVQWTKGMVKFGLHFAFVVAGVAHVLRRGRHLYLRTVGALVAGIALNAAYGVLQLVAQVGAGVNLDAVLIGPITFGQGGTGGINVYGQVAQTVAGSYNASSAGVFRVNAMALDPNHLGIMLAVPILIALPFGLRDGLRGRVGTAAWALVAGLGLVLLLTLSRSGMLGLACGLLVLAVPYRRAIFSLRLLGIAGAAFAALGLLIASSDYARQVFASRFSVSDRSAQIHYDLFSLVPPALEGHPGFGLGLNTFSVYYEFLTGKTNWGPHSFYVALLAETGLIGTLVFALFLAWLLVRLVVFRRAAFALEACADPDGRDVRCLAWGLTAALVATMAANVFYLTMQFYYFYALVLVIVAGAALYAPRAQHVLSRLRPALIGA